MLSNILKSTLAGEDYLPKYTYHVRETITRIDDGRVMFVVRCKGLPFEVISDGVLRNNYHSLNDLFLSIAKTTAPRMAVWAHLDHYETLFSTKYEFSFEWLKDMSQKYMEQFLKEPSFENDFYLTFVLKPGKNDDLEDCIKELEEIQIRVMQSLRPYEPVTLTSYRYESNLFSEISEFLAYLYNGFWERIPCTSLPLHQTIQSSSLYHGFTLLETRFPDGGRRFSALYDLKDFPEPTKKGMLNPLLSLPFPFLVNCSLTLLTSAESLKMIGNALNKMGSAGDLASDQHEDMEAGRQAVASGSVYFGEFHLGVMVHGASEKEAENRGATMRTTMSSLCGTQVVPATLSAPSTFYAMFPGNAKERPRPMPKNTRNFSGMFSMNTFSSGKQFGNPIGDGSAILPLKTSAKGVYHFNCHYTLPDKDFKGEKIPGHVLMIGATGVGKTTAQTTLLAFLERFDYMLFGIDKDGSMRGLTEGVGGTYFNLRAGEPTGLNPFQLDDTPMNRSFLYDLVGACGRRDGKEHSSEDIKDIKQAVDSVFELPFEVRRFGILLQNIPDRGEDCLVRRLANWCYDETDGQYAYALDNPTNAFEWSNLRRVAFDVTDFLKKGHPATEPILSYLLHLKSLMKKQGGLMCTVVEEFWLPLQYPTTAEQILDILKVGRRRDEFIMLVSQSPEDAIKSPLLPDILQQTPTKIYLANPDAEYTNAEGGGYVRLNVSTKEFSKIRALGKYDYKFLVKQGSQANIVKLDMSAVLDYIPVLAMAQEDFKYLDAAKAEVGNHPDAWVPFFIKLRRAGKITSNTLKKAA
ncbi:transporter [Massilia sp. CCM 9210]|uniref:VirB4 family type IV secretion/conjugal transfer ATPase n=1 Tax=Massilia scottii TaxID=3057166 RepID=UPI0027965A20|nr:transporter [Massilia sp. CCM 9210]MDQ1817820.1 transporter [Massilia sp. CCM 9210]